MHFETLWEKSEDFHKSSIPLESSEGIVHEITMKLGLYSAICKQNDLPENEKNIAKSHLLGEILFSITKLSLKDNINVFSALNIALLQNNINIRQIDE